MNMGDSYRGASGVMHIGFKLRPSFYLILFYFLSCTVLSVVRKFGFDAVP